MSDKLFQKSLNYRVAELLNNYSLKVKSLTDSGLPFSAKDVLKDVDELIESWHNTL